MRKETYFVKCPRHVRVGDPMYFEEYEGRKLKSLVVDQKIPKGFSARVVITEEELDPELFPEETFQNLSIYMAPEQYLDTYVAGKYYEGQQIAQKEIGVDTARYLLEIDDRYDEIKTGGDGGWGDYYEFYRKGSSGRKKIVDAIWISLVIPEEKTFDDVRRMLSYYFEDMVPLENPKDSK